MGDRTGIEWTDHTWNPWQGCVHVSEGCDNCYMYREKERYGQDPATVVRSKPPTFNAPLKWNEPGFVFTASWSDFFIQAADEWRDEAWAIIKRTPHLTYQVLTKRPKLIPKRLPADWGDGYPNVLLGVSVENQRTADERIPQLLDVPARGRFLSVEPLLGPINLSRHLLVPAARDERSFFCHDAWYSDPLYGCKNGHVTRHYLKSEQRGDLCLACYEPVYAADRGIHWVIAGGESGPGARPTHPDWARAIRDACVAAGVPFFWKQWGEWRPSAWTPENPTDWAEDKNHCVVWPSGISGSGLIGDSTVAYGEGCRGMVYVGKKNAGALLDGVEWKQFPEVRA